ncbi:hypothetical protein GGF31_000231 [Allomyces arbusculus]|nr:hypothetical protein GGF31_000231 [Allomyces arbusculus]
MDLLPWDRSAPAPAASAPRHAPKLLPQPQPHLPHPRAHLPATPVLPPPPRPPAPPPPLPAAIPPMPPTPTLAQWAVRAPAPPAKDPTGVPADLLAAQRRVARRARDRAWAKVDHALHELTCSERRYARLTLPAFLAAWSVGSPAAGGDAETNADGNGPDNSNPVAATPAPPTIPAEDAVLLVRSLPDLARQHALLARAMPAPTASPLRALSLSVPLPPSTRSSASFRNGSSLVDNSTLDGDDDDTAQWGLSPAAAIWACLAVARAFPAPPEAPPPPPHLPPAARSGASISAGATAPASHAVSAPALVAAYTEYCAPHGDAVAAWRRAPRAVHEAAKESLVLATVRAMSLRGGTARADGAGTDTESDLTTSVVSASRPRPSAPVDPMHRPIPHPPPASAASPSCMSAPRSVLDDDEPPALAAAWQRECQRLGCDRAGLGPDPHQRWTVPDLLMQPVQRLTRYGLLLQQLEDTLAAAAATLDPADMPHAVPVEVAMAAVARAKDTMRAVARAVDVQRREFERRAAARRFWTRVQVPPRPVLRGTLPTDLVVVRAGGLVARGSGSSAGDASVHTTTTTTQQQREGTPPLRRRRSSVEVGIAKLRASFESAANEFRLLPDLDIGTSLRESLEAQMFPAGDGALDTAAAAAAAPTPTTVTVSTPTTATAPAPSQPAEPQIVRRRSRFMLRRSSSLTLLPKASSLSAAGSSSGGPSVPPSPRERPTTWASPASTVRSSPSEHATVPPVPHCHAPPGESEGWSSLIATMRAKSELAVTAWWDDLHHGQRRIDAVAALMACIANDPSVGVPLEPLQLPSEVEPHLHLVLSSGMYLRLHVVALPPASSSSSSSSSGDHVPRPRTLSQPQSMARRTLAAQKSAPVITFQATATGMHPSGAIFNSMMSLDSAVTAALAPANVAAPGDPDPLAYLGLFLFSDGTLVTAEPGPPDPDSHGQRRYCLRHVWQLKSGATWEVSELVAPSHDSSSSHKHFGLRLRSSNAVVDLFARSLQTRTRWLAALYRVLRGALPTLWTDDYSTPRVSDDLAPLWLSQPLGWLPADADATVTPTFVQVPLEDPLTVCTSAPMTPPVSPTAPTVPHQARSAIAWSETDSPVSALSPAVTDSADWSQVAPVPPVPRRDRNDSVYWSRPGSADTPAAGTHGVMTMVSMSSLATGSAVSSSVRAPAGIAELVSESSASISLHRNGTGSTNRTASSGGTTPSAGSSGTAPPASAPGPIIGPGGDDPDYVVEDTLACFSVRPISQVSASASTSTVTSKRRVWTAAHDLTRRATQAVQQKRKARKDKAGKHDEVNGEETNVDTAFADLFTYIPTHRLTVLDMQAELEQPEPVGPAWTRQSVASEPVSRAAEPMPPPPPEPAHPPSEPPPSPTLSDLVLSVPICDEPSTARLAAPLPPLPPAAGGSLRLHVSDSTATMRASLASEASSNSTTRSSKVVVAPATSAAPLRRVPERTTSISIHSTPRRSLVSADRVPPGTSPPLPPRRGSGIGSPRVPPATSSPEVLAHRPSLVIRRKRSSIIVVVPAIIPAADPEGTPTAWPTRRPSVRAASPSQPRASESTASIVAPSSSKPGGLFTRVLRKWFGGGTPSAASGPSARPRSGSWSLRTSVGSKRGSIEERAHAVGNPPPLSKLGRKMSLMSSNESSSLAST